MTLTKQEEIAVAQVKIQALKDGYGPLFEIEEIGKGHELFTDDSGVCPTCGRVQVDSPSWNRDKWIRGEIKGCFEVAAVTVEFTYNSEGHRALYGVPFEGQPSCWAS